MVGRLAVTLDEVGIPIETGANVVKVEKHKAHLADGRHVETDDVIILACGYGQAKKLVPDLPEVSFVTASTIDVALDAVPLGDRHGILDEGRSMAIFDMKQIHPGIAPSGALLSAVHFGEGKGEDRLAVLSKFMDERALAGNHIFSMNDNKRMSKSLRLAIESLVVSLERTASCSLVLGLKASISFLMEQLKLLEQQRNTSARCHFNNEEPHNNA